MNASHHRGLRMVVSALLASSATLVCCVLPVFVSLGAAATLVGLISVVPQLVCLSKHKAWVFGLAAGLLIVSGAVLWTARRLPCPADPEAARKCMRLRATSHWVYSLAVLFLLVGATFAYVPPMIW